MTSLYESGREIKESGHKSLMTGDFYQKKTSFLITVWNLQRTPGPHKIQILFKNLNSDQKDYFTISIPISGTSAKQYTTEISMNHAFK